MATHPYITAAIPSVVTRHPDPPCMQRWSWTFNDHCRWRPGVNNDLRVRCACGQCNRAQCDQKAFFHSHEIYGDSFIVVSVARQLR